LDLKFFILFGLLSDLDLALKFEDWI